MSELTIPNLNRGVSFTIKAPFAHFRKFYTQTSMLSYALPPRTAISGIIGAVLGRPRNKVYKLMQPPNGFLAVQLLAPIRKVTFGENLLSTKNEFLTSLIKTRKTSLCFFDTSKNRTQVPFEVLMPKPPYKNLKYRVLFWHTDGSLLDMLVENLKNKRTYYPVYLGISEFLASIDFEGITKTAEILKNYNGKIHSVIVANNIISNTLVKAGNKFNVEYILLYMNDDFSAKYHTNVIFSEEANALNLGVNHAIKWKDFVFTPYEVINNEI